MTALGLRKQNRTPADQLALLTVFLVYGCLLLRNLLRAAMEQTSYDELAGQVHQIEK